MKHVVDVVTAPPTHWVGDGFPVRSIFSYSRHGRLLSPFLLLDLMGPADFPASTRPRGVGPHPHRGFETVTVVYAGEVSHRDSNGGGGTIGPGDVQWMTAADGIVHQEYHSEAFTKQGGKVWGAQLWVNLPARDKRSAPGYQAILARDIPVTALAMGAGTLRVIAGEYAGVAGPARTHTPMAVWDLRLAAGGAAELPFVDGWTVALVVMSGTLRVNGDTQVAAGQMAVLGADGSAAHLSADADTVVLVLSGAPIDEPIVGHGPFVMNTADEIRTAIADYEAGRFGAVA